MTRTASRLMMLAARNGIPVASPRVKDIPETAPSGYAYMLLPATRGEPAEDPSIHRDLDGALHAAYAADLETHGYCGCREPITEASLAEDAAIYRNAEMPHHYRQGMYAPNGCGKTMPDGDRCEHPLTNPTIYAVRFADLVADPLPASVGEDIYDAVAFPYRRN